MVSNPQTPMERALELAKGVLGTTSPNPAVGCVIVKDGAVVGEGATRPPGEAHAEVRRPVLDGLGLVDVDFARRVAAVALGPHGVARIEQDGGDHNARGGGETAGPAGRRPRRVGG